MSPKSCQLLRSRRAPPRYQCDGKKLELNLEQQLLGSKKKKTQVIGTQSTADQRKPQFQDVPIGLKRYKITETHVERDHGRRVD